ncbi:hypothetical protein Desaci_4771 (plasmid) [Desulfosporosinus acidiphilus SJ4]|uniref:Uncharacterized protein n=1 Tax=Desulfosporosinus acidiphilus (strain DSM 22704 / JCM 16185 / SJ4) TaxID=646529 RepID=I4DCS3_DESAJ|nr:hypothetical protein [Desulfosporosinus acidiphilus]AFM43597.1 hypothetical protein Desaci_4771 [Desulfosporosinus acidiphilus SJ4]
MKARPHLIFYKSQTTVKLDLPNDVFWDFMSLCKRINFLLTNGYRITPDDLNTMALEDFTERYLGNEQDLMYRLEGK